MSTVQNVIVENATGDAVGLVCLPDTEDPWQHFAHLDQATHSLRTDAPMPCFCRGVMGADNKHNWNGTAWAEVPQDAVTSVRFHAASKMRNDPVTVTETTGWQDIGFATSTPAFFTSRLSNISGRTVGRAKVAGTGAEIQIVERDEDGTDTVLMTSPLAVADTATKWKTFQASTDVPPSLGTFEYVVQARLNGATSMEVRGTSLSLLEIG